MVSNASSLHTVMSYLSDVRQGLVYMNIRPYTDDEWDNLPHVTMTRDTVWDASVFDCELSDGDGWQNFVYDKFHGYSYMAFDDEELYKY
jgi:hypothetical protein